MNTLAGGLFFSLLCLLTAGLSGALLSHVGMPLGWFFGALLSAALLQRYRPAWRIHDAVRDLARITLGVLIGASFAPDIFSRLAQFWLLTPLVLLYTGGMLLVGSGFFRRYAHFDRRTAFFSAIPGGLTEMLTFSTQVGADTRAIVVTHLTRFVVIMAGISLISSIAERPAAFGGVPATPLTLTGAGWLLACGLAGGLMARALRIRLGLLLFPLLLSAGVHAAGLTTPTSSPALLALCQMVIGLVSGSKLGGLRQGSTRDLLVAAGFWALLLFVLTLAAAAGATTLMDQSLLTLLLAVIPGGITEISVLALALGADMTLVMTAQLSRQVGILLFIQLFLHRMAASPTAGGQPPGGKQP
ncbi:AbrB family transcriptional regulator [Brenneria tiliae]|uniref:AbrB family transcriptional regulator n=1 Tax=Brenneria tiliae TaxID=2914984 RepID=A0ABT0MWQ3_9GAMM|nr:AbrB family transcriptional regulator [Brenneria tiliae]MCL2893728.1 AbrB family transcriptional regulator [Brenneria tiliae]